MSVVALHTEPTPKHAASPQPPTRKAIAPGQLLIGGRWVDAQAGDTMDVTDPTPEASITRVQKGSAADANHAIDAACAAYADDPSGRSMHSSGPPATAALLLGAQP